MPYDSLRIDSPIAVTVKTDRAAELVKTAAELAKSLQDLTRSLQKTAGIVDGAASEAIQNQPPKQLAPRPILSSSLPKAKKAASTAPAEKKKAAIVAKVVVGLEMVELPVEKGLKNSRSVSITPAGKVAAKTEKETMDIFAFTIKGDRVFKLHLPESTSWTKVELSDRRPLWMAAGAKRQIELDSGNNIIANLDTGKIFVLTVIKP